MGAEDIERQQPERPADARARGRGPVRHVRHRHAQGRDQRGDARLGHERRHDPLRPRLGDGPAPVPDDRARPPARIGDEAAAQLEPSRVACPTSPLPASAAARTRSGCSRGSSASRRSGSRSPRRPATGSRPGRHAAALAGGSPGHPPRRPLADAPGPRRPGRRGPLGLGRARLPGRRPAARGARRPPAGSSSPRRPTPRRSRRWSSCPEPRGSCRPSRRPTPSRSLPRLLAGVEGSGAGYPDETVALLGFSGRGDKDLAALGRWLDARR